MTQGGNYACISSSEDSLLPALHYPTFEMAQSCSLRPGDRAVMRGTLQQQTVALENGATTIISHFYVTSLGVLSRSKRTSITVYEKEKTR